MNGWEPIDTAPRDGTPIDVWLVGHREDVDFYCAVSLQIPGHGKLCEGRATDWHFKDGKWRPVMQGLNVPTFIQPQFWREVPKLPHA